MKVQNEYRNEWMVKDSAGFASASKYFFAKLLTNSDFTVNLNITVKKTGVLRC